MDIVDFFIAKTEILAEKFSGIYSVVEIQPN